MKKLPIGISDYKTIIEENYYYIDKTLFIKEILDEAKAIILLPRPRRFGKTLNLSMLQYFFEKSQENNQHLFTDKAIWQHEKCRTYQGQYPVIFLTLKDVKQETWGSAYKKLEIIIAREFERHAYLLDTGITERAQKEFKEVLEKKADEETLSQSLYFLSELLYKHYKKRVYIFIDEYDMPITTSYGYDYYKNMIVFMRSLLGTALKDNKFLERGILTGILRIAKESIFSGMNNFKVCSLLDRPFQDKFGFTPQEVKHLLVDQRLTSKAKEIQAWYNGYTFGTTTIYNPWSIIFCVDERGLFKPYWLNTSDNELIKKLLALSSEDMKFDLEQLMVGKSITKEIDDAIVFPGIENNDNALWALLLFSGYLTSTTYQLIDGKNICNLAIPNRELKIVYTDFVKEVFRSSLTQNKINALLKALVQGDSSLFARLLQDFITKSMSMFDFSSDEPEKSYHLFILGLLVYLSDTHELKSNRESGYGRYDIMIIPRTQPSHPASAQGYGGRSKVSAGVASNALGIIIEFKKTEPKETLAKAAERALEQIKEREYISEFHERGIKKIQLLGIACKGKKILVKADDL